MEPQITWIRSQLEDWLHAQHFAKHYIHRQTLPYQIILQKAFEDGAGLPLVMMMHIPKKRRNDTKTVLTAMMRDFLLAPKAGLTNYFFLWGLYGALPSTAAPDRHCHVEAWKCNLDDGEHDPGSMFVIFQG